MGVKYMNQQEVYKSVFKEYPDVLDVTQLSRLLSISKKTAYNLLKRGDIESLKVGREYKIPKLNIIRYLRLTELK